MDITYELYLEIRNRKTSIKGELEIKLINNAHNQYAYNYAEYTNDENRKEVFLSFYVSERTGYDSPVFVIDKQKKILDYFDDNFEHLFKTETVSLLKFKDEQLTLSKQFQNKYMLVEERLKSFYY